MERLPDDHLLAMSVYERNCGGLWREVDVMREIRAIGEIWYVL